ncbi:MAG: DUF1045 domain-containing protein [Hyphomicrobiales bacterium]|nr:DUF1045 domain-containing protein [Hyphomicrobiales bacterium]MCP4997703.1 DUF1045 domain-containing protein [Hyphomicrobiales bacterium]
MRYAVYFCPPLSNPLTRVATNWLGRSAFTDETFETPAVSGLTNSEIAFHTAAPARYGFHGTLNAPFHLASDADEAALVAALTALSTTVAQFEIPRLVISRIGLFFALVPEKPVAELRDLADRCVLELDRFRAPLSEADIARRAPQNLSSGQLANLQRWGYPYVFDEFRFHMTLTGPVENRDADRVKQALHGFFDPVLCEPIEVRAVALFTETERGSPFLVQSHFPLKTGEKRRSA